MLPHRKQEKQVPFGVLRQAVQVCVSPPRQGYLEVDGVGEGIERDLGADRVRSPQGSRTQLTGREGMCPLLTVQPLPILPLPLFFPPQTDPPSVPPPPCSLAMRPLCFPGIDTYAGFCQCRAEK